MKKKMLFIPLACLLAIVWIASASLAEKPEWAGVPGPPDHAKAKIPWYTPPEPGEELLTVLDPRGTRQAFEVFGMADRFDTLVGKTVYIVCVGFCHPLHEILPTELERLYPDTNWITVNKYGTYFQDDPDLWDEIESAGAGAILHTGH